jgi:ABC-type phosphate transport system auxiliary subunit
MDDPSVQQLIQKFKAVRLEERKVQFLQKLRGEFTMEGTPKSCGDRMRIKNNELCRPTDWNNTIIWVEERRATVTRVVEGQIHFITLNGVRTWRAPNNMRRL